MGVRGLTLRLSRRFALILALAQLLLIYAWIVEPNWIEVTSHEAWFKNLPEEFNGLVVAHLSDLHMRKYGARERRVVARLAESAPGVIVITGDLTLEGRSEDRKSTRLNSSHLVISYAVFCLKKKKKNTNRIP